ncbi:hypothetical protein ANO14919_070250 [Xylariales sp. No.14919]|nr:hypothetical protein ANO14919_070250 [Xylariales sp. No.14919]
MSDNCPCDRYNLFQQIYILSMITGLASDVKDTEQNIQDRLEKCLQGTLPKLACTWKLSWGPRVFKKVDDPEQQLDNAWYAAIDHTKNICVVAIAGTASSSMEELIENFRVNEVVDFNAWVGGWSTEGIPEPTITPPADINPELPYCARGTSIGVWNILSNVSTTTAGQGMRIDEYLRTLGPEYTIVVTGHSLGGALSPIVALGLKQANLLSGYEVKALPSAGVSPGNDVLARRYAEAFPKDPSAGESYRVYNMDFYNVYDFVPQAWSLTDADRNLNNILGKILHIPEGDLLNTLQFLVALAVGRSEASGIPYTPLQGQNFEGSPPPPDSIETEGELGDVLSWQHVGAYWDEIGITDFMQPVKDKF